MFQITRSPFGAFTRVDVTNTANGSSFSIVPEMGATLIDLVFNGHSVMDGYKTPAELEEGKWAKSAFLFPFPNRLRDGRYTWNGHTYQFPINNATTDNAIHGFVRHKPFTLADTVIGKKEAFVVLDYEDDGSNEAYPFRFTISLMISLDLENRFEFDVSILNQNQFQIPFGMGWHPYFRLAPNADQHLLQLPQCIKIDIDKRMIPNGRFESFHTFDESRLLEHTVLDNCFLARSDQEQYQIELTGPDGNRLFVSAPKSDWPYFQIFTPPHRESIAIEPMTCNIDALNNGEGLRVLGPYRTWGSRFSVWYL